MIKKVFIVLVLLLMLQGCNSHPRDKTNLDDIVHCGFGKEYVDGYTTSSGKKVNGYCRKSN